MWPDIADHIGYSARMRINCFVLSLALVACGGASSEPTTPASPPNTGPTLPAPAPEAKKTPAAAPSETAAQSPAAPPPEAAAEKCEGEWICVKVSFDTKKVEKRETKLIGDPKIEQTWSKNTDGRPATFDRFSKGAVDLTLRRKPGNKNEIVVKIGKGPEIVIDRRDGSVDDFTHVGAIAAEQGGDLLVDLRYMK
jgi:hypothetical protein